MQNIIEKQGIHPRQATRQTSKTMQNNGHLSHRGDEKCSNNLAIEPINFKIEEIMVD